MSPPPSPVPFSYTQALTSLLPPPAPALAWTANTTGCPGLRLGLLSSECLVLDGHPHEPSWSFRNLAIGIGIQNFPEGLAVSLPLRGAGFSTWRAFW